MHEWRNWKTRRAKDAVPERACEFDSRLVYQKYITGWLTNKAEKEMKTIKKFELIVNNNVLKRSAIQ